MKRRLIRGIWGGIDSNGIRNGKMRKDIDTIKANPYCSNDDFSVYVFGLDNFCLLKSEGFDCKLIHKNPVMYDMEKQLYRHKLDIVKEAMEDYDEIVFLDWDCVPTAELPSDFWETMAEKAPFQANLFQYRTKKCLWRKEDVRKVCNGGFLYLREKQIAQDFINNYQELSDWVDKQKKARESQGKKLRFREEALIFDDEPAITKWVDDDMGGWKGIEIYWDKYEPYFCNVKKKSVFPKERLITKRECFLHWG